MHARIPRWVPSAGAVLVAAVAGAFILFANRGTTFLLDDWAYLVQRVQTLNADTLFASQNGNWTTTLVLVYRGLAELFGIGSYLPWRLFSLAVHLICCGLVYVLARRRLGPWWALIPLVLVLISRGWETLLWPFQVGQLLSLAAGVGALLALDRRNWRGDVGASLLLVIALASSSFGPPFVVLVAVELLLSRWRSLWLLAAPAAAYLWWNETYNSVLSSTESVTVSAFRYAFDMAWDIMPGGPAAVFGTSLGVGRLLLYAVAALTLARIVVERRLPARLLALIVAYVAYWWLVAWARSEVPDLAHAPRYVGLAVLLFVLIGVELFSGLRPEQWPERLRAPLRGRPAAGMVLFAVAVLITARGVVLSADAMKDGSGTTLRPWGQRMLAQEAAFGVARPALADGAPFYIETSGWFALVLPLAAVEATAERFGGDLYPGEEKLLSMSYDARQYADQAVARAVPATVPDPTTGSVTSAPVEVLDADVTLKRDGGCVSWSSRQRLAIIHVALPPDGLRVTNDAIEGDMAITPVRWVERPQQAAALLPSRHQANVVLRPDHSKLPWKVEIGGTAGSICSLGA